MVGDLRKSLEKIASKHSIFECVTCANKLQKFLINNKIPGKRVTLSTGCMDDPYCNIYHDESQENISVNGRHVAVMVLIKGQEIIFDSLYPRGIPET